MDPLVSAAVQFLSAAGAGMAGEVGKRAWELAGLYYHRLTGRPSRAPAGGSERERVIGELVARAADDPALAAQLASWAAAAGPSPFRPGAPVPRDLPLTTRHFTDRKDLLAALDREAARPADGSARVVQLCGGSGYGKGTLANHWGHGAKDRFPDGQLHLDLRGGGSPESALRPEAVLRALLRRLGVPAERIPPALADRTDLFRTFVADRRLLVVLHHAHSAAQVAPLLSAAPGVLVLVTAERPLDHLEALVLNVGPLAARDARQLLTSVAGKEAVRAAKAVLPGVLERCAGSPYALHAAARRLGRQVAGAPVGGDPMRLALEDGYRELDADAARLFRLAALRPWPVLTAPLAAALTGRESEQALADLAAEGLLEPVGGGYRYRDSARRYGQELSRREDGDRAGAEAIVRAVAHLRDFALAADYSALRDRPHLSPRFEEFGPDTYPTPGEAISALDSALPNLIEAVVTAEHFGLAEEVCELVEGLWALQLKVGRNDELVRALQIGDRIGIQHFRGTPIAARLTTQLAFALMDLQRHGEAEQAFARAAVTADQAGRPMGRATAVESVGLLRLSRWEYAEALEKFTAAAAVLELIGPDHPDADKAPRARALLHRHKGRALRGLQRQEEARAELAVAIRFFRGEGKEDYNLARSLTDLAESYLASGEPEAALPVIDEALVLLTAENATQHVVYLRELRERSTGSAH
ncbi:tetratricopeptide repeat protein [Kitasatospora sp. NPDC006697]|uniref:tetratricopeptide repeat protein n=1 Tax=Kitasatospora sp. NPDC006697 TaxID=3364020 RepID=UPI0036C16E82